MSVYFARVGDYVKIGYSQNPVSRATTITRSGIRPDDVEFGSEVDLIGWVPGDEWLERAFHVQHIEHRVAGEWFRLDRKLAEAIIWDDPRGVDLERMSALSVLVALEYPEATRQQIADAGLRVEAASVDEAFAALSSSLSGIVAEAGAS